MDDSTSMSFPPNSLISPFEDDDCLWEAVQSRNAKADGHFVYAVRTTRIYSRPACKARLAQRDKIAFFKTGDQAQRAGYRPCKRCHPEVGVLMPEEEAARKIRNFVEQRPVAKGGTEMMLSLSQMARQAGLSKWYFHRAFRKYVGVTPVEYLRIERKTAKLAIANASESALPEDRSRSSYGAMGLW
nr:AraC-type transcriptional regulator [Trichoderma psychrophilum]